MGFVTGRVAVICLVVAGLTGAAQAEEARTITVTGSGIVTVEPDMAIITIGVESRAKEAADAMAETSAKMAALFELAREGGIDASDMQTSRLSLNVSYNHSGSTGPSIDGYVATNTVHLKLREITRAGNILDRLLRGGANVLHGISFDIQERKPLLREARRLAVADALEKAGLYATAAGGETGAVLSINENATQNIPVPMMRAAAMSEAMPVAEGELSVSASVNLVIELK